jgi:hypothetical protein
MTDDGVDDSLVDRVSSALAGPTAGERASRLKARARDAPGDFDAADIETVGELLGKGDPEVVGDALAAAEALSEARPALVAPLAPDITDCLHERPAEEWASTTLGDAERPFMNDLMAGSALLELARADLAHLEPVADDLVNRMQADSGRIEPHTLFALATLAAAGVDLEVPTTALVDPIARTLRSSVESEADDGLTITVATAREQVELLQGLDHPDALPALRHAETATDDGALADAAATAIDEIED